MNRILRVVLTGSESTGKTSLARCLADHYHTVWAPEYLRRFVQEIGALPSAADTRRIARGHLEQEQRYLQKARRVLFLDTDLFSTCVYHRYYFETPCDWEASMAVQRQADLYLLMDTDIPWMPDPGQRDGPGTRDALHPLIVTAMQLLPHVMISGDYQARFASAVLHVDRLLNTMVYPSRT